MNGLLRSGQEVREARGDLQKGAAGYPKPRHAPTRESSILIDTENWSSMQADTKGDIYEGLLLAKSKEH